MCGSVFTLPIPGKCFRDVYSPTESYPLITAFAKGITISGFFRMSDDMNYPNPLQVQNSY